MRLRVAVALPLGCSRPSVGETCVWKTLSVLSTFPLKSQPLPQALAGSLIPFLDQGITNINAFSSNGLLKIWSYLSVHAFLSMNFLCVMISCKFERYSQDLAIHGYLAWWIVNLKCLGR